MLLGLKDLISSIERSESNNSRRYKLLIYFINEIVNNKMLRTKILENKNDWNTKYRFEKGKLIIVKGVGE